LGLGDDDAVASGPDAVDGDIVGDADTREAPDNDLGERDIVARSLCTLIRSARTERSVIALRAQADVLEVDTHPDYLDLMASMGV
jgi:hypothetical protein